MGISFAPSRFNWFVSRGLNHLPLIKPFLEKREMIHLVELGHNSLKKKQSFRVLDSGWMRKAVKYDVEEVQARLACIDKTNRSMLGDILQSMHWSRIREYPYAANQLKNLPKDGRIADCGCGAASFQFYLAEKGFEVYSVDCNLSTLERVAAFKKHSGVTNLKPTFGSVLKLPFTSEYFDGVICISVLEHIIVSSEYSRLILLGSINEMLRVLKKEGLLVLTFDVNFGKERRHLSPNELTELCDALQIDSEPLPEDRLYSSDTKEGSLMGKDLAVYYTTLTKC